MRTNSEIPRLKSHRFLLKKRKSENGGFLIKEPECFCKFGSRSSHHRHITELRVTENTVFPPWSCKNTVLIDFGQYFPECTATRKPGSTWLLSKTISEIFSSQIYELTISNNVWGVFFSWIYEVNFGNSEFSSWNISPPSAPYFYFYLFFFTQSGPYTLLYTSDSDFSGKKRNKKLSECKNKPSHSFIIPFLTEAAIQSADS